MKHPSPEKTADQRGQYQGEIVDFGINIDTKYKKNAICNQVHPLSRRRLDKGYCVGPAPEIARRKGIHLAAIQKNNMKMKNKDRDR